MKHESSQVLKWQFLEAQYFQKLLFKGLEETKKVDFVLKSTFFVPTNPIFRMKMDLMSIFIVFIYDFLFKFII